MGSKPAEAWVKCKTPLTSPQVKRAAAIAILAAPAVVATKTQRRRSLKQVKRAFKVAAAVAVVVVMAVVQIAMRRMLEGMRVTLMVGHKKQVGHRQAPQHLVV